MTDGALVQVIGPAESFAVETSLVADFKEAREKANRFVHRPFDLSRELPIRAHIFCLSDQRKWLLAAVIHHIATDGWSEGVLFRELSSMYEALASNKPKPLSDLPDTVRRFRPLAAESRARHHRSRTRLLGTTTAGHDPARIVV